MLRLLKAGHSAFGFIGAGLLFLFVTTSAAFAQTRWYVDSTTTVTQPPSGLLSWTNPYRFLNDVLQHPGLLQGDTIWLRGDRTYYPDQSAANPHGTGDVTASFVIPFQIRLIGGFAGTEVEEEDRGDWLAHPVWLSGDVKHEDPAGQIVTEDNYTAAFLSDPPNYSTLAENALPCLLLAKA